MTICPCGKHLSETDTSQFCDWCSDVRNAPVIQLLLSRNAYYGHYTHHVSPSQWGTYAGKLKADAQTPEDIEGGCQRKWALDKIGGIRRPDTKATLRGRAVHGVLEHWTLRAIPPDLNTEAGQIAQPVLAHIPTPLSSGVIAEREIRWWPEGPGIGNLWVFLKDLERPSTLEIWDYKTYSRPEFNLTADDLVNRDCQGITYAAHAFVEYVQYVQGTDLTREVKGTWLYTHANKPRRCLPVVSRHNRDNCLRRFALIDAVASDMMRHLRERTDPLSLPPNVEVCEFFGGCPYRDQQCVLSAEERLIALVSQSNQSNQSDALHAAGTNFLQGFLGQVAAIANGQQPGQAIPAVAMAQPAIIAPVAEVAKPIPAPVPQNAPFAGGVPGFVQPPAFAPPTFAAAAPVPALASVVQPPAFAPPVQAPPQAVAAPPAIALPPVAVSQSSLQQTAAAIVAEVGPKKSKSRTKREAVQSQCDLGITEQAEIPQQSGTFTKADRGDDIKTTLLIDIAIAMAQNPGYCALNSVDFAARAQALAIALESL